MKLRNFWLLLIAVGSSGLGLFAAADSAGGRSSDRSEEGTIADAKKSFDSLKQKRVGEERSLNLPKLSTPELNLAGPSAATRPKKKSADKNSKSWLVDGVMNPKADPSKPGSVLDANGRESDQALEPGLALSDQRSELASGETKGPENLQKSAREAGAESSPSLVHNPLASFMSSWISSQDRSLLLPSTPNATGSVDLAGGRVGRAAGQTSAPGPTVNGSFMASSGSRPARLENPYLAFAPVSVAESGLGVSSALRAEVRDPIPRAAEPVLRFGQEARDPMPSGKASAREFLKSDEDNKYFKQLKRF